MDQDAKQILVVEDHPALSRIICFNLEKAGYRVTSARNGREALELVRGRGFDLVVTDQQMPEMNGWEFVAEMRQGGPCREVPIIFLTAKGLELDARRMEEELGVTMMFAKPFSPTELVRAIDKQLESQPASVQPAATRI